LFLRTRSALAGVCRCAPDKFFSKLPNKIPAQSRSQRRYADRRDASSPSANATWDLTLYLDRRRSQRNSMSLSLKAGSPDALTEVLNSLRLQGQVFCLSDSRLLGRSISHRASSPTFTSSNAAAAG